jgi:(E)-4-hydroxy-3-methylbut-2-enyl-diphosphate synthase
MIRKTSTKYCEDLGSYKKWETREIHIGDLKLGGNNPVRLQSMSSKNPMDTQANVEQAIRIIEAGGELVRFTAPTVKDAENIGNISKSLHKKGYNTPLVADIHFNPKAAMVAADFVEKVRVNPGNFAEVSKTKINYTEEEYENALLKIETKFVELIDKCKKLNRAIRIGSNHGSLSQRVMDRYGDTPEGMVEAAMEFLRIAVKHNFYDIVLSMKSSNIRVMVQAYRLLAARMREEDMNFPLHLGVTEAGEGEDGRIKSAAGIGTLLEDGLGDTIRVSLTEEPEFEIPVAKAIADRYKIRKQQQLFNITELPYSPFEFTKRESKSTNFIGGRNEMPVIGLDWIYSDEYCNSDKKQIIPFANWNKDQKLSFPIIDLQNYISQKDSIDMAFVEITSDDFVSGSIEKLTGKENIVLVINEVSEFSTHAFRYSYVKLLENNYSFPVILRRKYTGLSEIELQLYAAIDFGSLLVDGFGDGIWLETDADISQERLNDISLGILQASRARISKTEFISCPSCGRTLFNIQEATTTIRKRTSHLKGLKIAVMGCIVNGPGEMADADYGYVGAGHHKINLYKGKEVIEKGIAEDAAVDALIDLIKSHGDWVEP